MWFNNVISFEYEIDDLSQLTELLETQSLKPCPPHSRFIYGWSSLHENSLVQDVAGAKLINMVKEERLLPRKVITKILAERTQAWELHQGKSMRRQDKAKLAEELEFELLPKAFCLQKNLYACFDTIEKRLLLNTASINQASQFTALLRKSVPDLQVFPLQAEENLSLQFAEWIKHPHTLPNNFQLANDCVLYSPENEKKYFNCKGYDLPSEEVLILLSKGLVVAEISLIWNDRVQFTLTQDLILKRIKCLDYLVDELQEINKLDEEIAQKEAALTLLAGELRSLINALLKAFKSQAIPSRETLEVAQLSA